MSSSTPPSTQSSKLPPKEFRKGTNSDNEPSPKRVRLQEVGQIHETKELHSILLKKTPASPGSHKDSLNPIDPFHFERAIALEETSSITPVVDSTQSEVKQPSSAFKLKRVTFADSPRFHDHPEAASKPRGLPSPSKALDSFLITHINDPPFQSASPPNFKNREPYFRQSTGLNARAPASGHQSEVEDRDITELWRASSSTGERRSKPKKKQIATKSPDTKEEPVVMASVRTVDETHANRASNTIIGNPDVQLSAFQACLHFIITAVYSSLHTQSDAVEAHVVFQASFLVDMINSWKATINTYLYRLHVLKEFSIKYEVLKRKGASTELILTSVYDFVSDHNHMPSDSYIAPLVKLTRELGKQFNGLYKFLDLLQTIVNPLESLALVEENREALDQANYIFVHEARRRHFSDIQGRARRTIAEVGEGPTMYERAQGCCLVVAAATDIGGIAPWKLMVEGFKPDALTITPAVRKTVKRVFRHLKAVLELDKELFVLVADAVDQARSFQGIWEEWTEALARSQTELETQSGESAAPASLS